MNKSKLLAMLFIPTAAISVDFDISDEIEIPNICENIPDFQVPVDLSAVCLSAQIAAQSFPALLPAANSLCQILEGRTATVGVIQLEVNNIYEKCQTEITKLETEMLKGISGYANVGSTINELKRKLNQVTDIRELLFRSLEEDGNFIEVSNDEWYESFESVDNQAQKESKKHYFEQVAAAEYLSDSMIKSGENAQSQIQILEQFQAQAGTDLSVKASQDINVRLSAEIAYQQQVFQQLITQYLRLESAEQSRKLAEESYYHSLFQDNEE